MDNGYAMSLEPRDLGRRRDEEYMTSIGRILPDYQGNESWMLPIPATFVVGQDGRIKALLHRPGLSPAHDDRRPDRRAAVQ